MTVNGTTVSFGSDVPITYSNIQSIAVNGGTGADVLTQSAQPGGGAALAFVPTSADTLNIDGGIFTIPVPPSGSGFVAYPLANLNIANGAALTVQTAATNDRTILVVGSLSIGSTGKLDLGGNDMIVHNDPSGTNTFNDLAQGFNSTGAVWSGDGLASSVAAETSNMALGMEVNAVQDSNGNYTNAPLRTTFDNQTVSAGDVLVKYTFYGDADLDGQVTGDDYALIDNAFNSQSGAHPLSGWFNGDFNYDGIINGDDYTLIDNAFNTQSVINPATVTSSLIADSAVATISDAAMPPIKTANVLRVPPSVVVAPATASTSTAAPPSFVDDILDVSDPRRRKGSIR